MGQRLSLHRRQTMKSLYPRIIIVFITAGFLANLIAFKGFRSAFDLGESREQLAGKILLHYAGLIVRDIGLPPQQDRVQKFHDDLGIDLRIEGPGGPWNSRPQMPSLD